MGLYRVPLSAPPACSAPMRCGAGSSTFKNLHVTRGGILIIGELLSTITLIFSFNLMDRLPLKPEV